ncbi:YD repeat-containing protein [Chitinophaga jiangningensis]|uniref:YD repeat-containing protein n=2 Tax=Chitinophaga jiangningensis TaxID=1419482 RepID=A0A1M7DNK3_9BACT|nr:YD repeat-containing protein [Chitinophaga jiangningensis]
MGILVLPQLLPAQVNYATGAVQANIPIYQFSNNSRLNMSVSLDYTGANGIRVNEIAPPTGLGWSLNAGGVVSRVVNNKPDDQYGNIAGKTSMLGRLYSGQTDVTDCFSDVTSSIIDDANLLDRQADYFSFDLNGRTGTFVIKTKANGETEFSVAGLEDNKLKVQVVEEDMSASNIITRISKFIITTEEGIQYVFSEKELTELMTSNKAISTEYVPGESLIPTGYALFIDPNNPPPPPEKISINLWKTGKYVINNWYLSEIRNPLNQQNISFTYNTYDKDFILLSQPVMNAIVNSDGTTSQTSYTIVNQRFVGKLKRLMQIDLPENKKVKFSYNMNRIDMPEDGMLSSIDIYSNDAKMNGFGFQYAYTHLYSMATPEVAATRPASEIQYMKLLLVGITRTAGPVTPFLDLQYKLGTGTPPRSSVWQDQYGYYTGSMVGLNNTYANCFNYEARKMAINHTEWSDLLRMSAQNGMLSRMTYPTGGYTEYTYEPNDVMAGSSFQYTGGVRVSKILIHDGINHANDQITTYKYKLTNGNSSGTGFETPVYSLDMNTFYAKTSIHGASRVIFVAANVALGFGGTYCNMASAFTSTTGFLKIIDDIVSVFAGGRSISTETVTTRTWSMQPLQSTNPLPAVYSRVEIINGTESQNLGKSVVDLTSYIDRAAIVPALATPFSARQRLEQWAIGLPKRVATFNAAGELVKEEVKQYAFTTNTLTDNGLLSCKCGLTNTYSNIVVPNSYLPQFMTFIKDVYSPVTGRAEVSKYIVRNYYPDNTFQAEEQSYEYDPFYYNLKVVRSTTSKGETIERRIYYPYNYTTSAGIAMMMSANYINAPVGAEIFLLRNGQEPKMIDGYFSNFELVGDGDIRPTSKYIFQSAKAVPESEVGPFNQQLYRNPAYFKKAIDYTYDNAGNMIQANEGGIIRNYLYNDRGFPVAAITNASLFEVAFTGFESTLNKGGWIYSGQPSAAIKPTPQFPYVIEQNPASGLYFYYIAGYPITRSAAGLVAGKKYRISYWKKKEGATAATPLDINYPNTVKQTNNFETYTCFEHEFTAGSADIVISGVGALDNLRLYPADAFMTTYDYDAKGNVTSIIDLNDIVTQYQYDNSSRVNRILDMKGSILKAVDYTF